MRSVEFSDMPGRRGGAWLTPTNLAMALAALRWSVERLSTLTGIDAHRLRQFINCGAISLDSVEMHRVLVLLLQKVEFTTSEDECGVLVKPGINDGATNVIQFGGPLKLRPPL